MSVPTTVLMFVPMSIPMAVHSHQKEMETAHAKLAETEELLQRAKAEVEAAGDQVRHLQEENARLAGELQELHENRRQYAAAVEAAEADAKCARSEVVLAQMRITLLSEQLMSQEQELSMTSVAVAAAAVAAVSNSDGVQIRRGGVGAVEGRIEDMQATITTLQTTVQGLQSELHDARDMVRRSSDLVVSMEIERQNYTRSAAAVTSSGTTSTTAVGAAGVTGVGDVSFGSPVIRRSLSASMEVVGGAWMSSPIAHSDSFSDYSQVSRHGPTVEVS